MPKLRVDILEHKEQILTWIDQRLSKKEIAHRLQCKIQTLNNYLEKMGINYRGQINTANGRESNKYVKSSYYTEDNSHKIGTYKLKTKLIKEGIKLEQCELCGLTEWQGQKIPLELHHINGNRYDNCLGNLQILCPNCHSIQNNNCGKNIGKYNPFIVKKTVFCKSCGRVITNYTKNNLCTQCFAESRKKPSRPDRNQLKEDIRNNSFVAVSKKYGVSDKAIVKWCVSYGLPSRAKDIKNISDKDWENM